MAETSGANSGRLIVLLPACLANHLDLARKIHGMALRDRRDVLYLTLIDDQEDFLPMTRCMTTMAAMTGGNLLNVQTKTVLAVNWLPVLRELYQPGDVLVCQVEQVVRAGWLRTLPVSVFLREAFASEEAAHPQLVLLEMQGYYHPARVQANHWLHQLAFIVGCLLILVVFSVLEFQLETSIQGAARLFLLSVMVLFEFGAIWAWSRIVSH